jgi:nitrogen regulatory protein PII
MMEMHRKKRIEIILEAPAMNRLAGALENAGVTGYTVLPVLAGKGKTGAWTRDGLIGGAGAMVCVICITDPTRVDAVLERIMAVLSRQIGLVTIGDVDVVRGERF